MTPEKSSAEDARVARAEMRFKTQELRASDARKALDEISAAKRAELAKTERLRALRLAKEEADRIAAVAQPRTARKKPAPSKVRKAISQG
jgi:hypothetical protein